MTSQQPPEGLSAENCWVLQRNDRPHTVFLLEPEARAELDRRRRDELAWREQNKHVADVRTYWNVHQATLNAARSTSPAPDPKGGEREQVADVVRALREASDERQRVAWTRMDGGQEWSLAAVLADQAADLIEQLSDQLAEARSEVERLTAQEAFDDDLSDQCMDALLAAEAERDTLAAQLVGAREALKDTSAQLERVLDMMGLDHDGVAEEALYRAKDTLSMSILRGDKGCSLGAEEAPSCGSPADSQPSGGAE